MNRLFTQEELEIYSSQLDEQNEINTDRVAQRTNEMVQNRRRLDKTNHQFVFFIHGPKPLSDPKDQSALINMFCKNRADIKYAEIGAPEQSPAGYHQHCLVILKENYRFQKVPKFIDHDGNVYTINFGEVRAYSKHTGDFKYYIYYIRKHSSNIQKAYYSINNGFLNEQGEQIKDKNEKVSYDHDIQSALEMDNLQEALSYMDDRHPARFLKDEQQFRRKWYGKHLEDIRREQMKRDDLAPFKEDLQAVQDIRKWVAMSLANKRRRMGNLFIVGPSKMGKSEFIIQEIYLKHKCFLMKGDFDFTGYNEDENYDFIIFDDVNYMRADNLERIRSITSTVNAPVIIDIKYGSKTVISKPIIHLINEHQYNNIIATIKRSHSQEWWYQNMTTVKITEPLFDKKEAKKAREQLAMPMSAFTPAHTPSSVEELGFSNNTNQTMSQQTQEEPPRTPEPTPYKNSMFQSTQLDERSQEEKDETPKKTEFTGEVAVARERIPKTKFIDRMSMKLSAILPEELYEQVREQVDNYLKEKGEKDDTLEEEETEDQSLLEDEFEEMEKRTRPDFEHFDEEAEERKRNAPEYMYRPSKRRFEEKTPEDIINQWQTNTSFGFQDENGILYD